MHQVAGSGANATLTSCLRDDFCKPEVLDAFKLDAIPLGDFYDRVELPWDYKSYRTQGKQMMTFDTSLGLQFAMENGGTDIQLWSEMSTWRMVDFPRRTENCDAKMA